MQQATMKKTLLLLATAFFYTIAYAQTWSVDKEHSSLKFGITHLGIAEVDGRFKDFTAKITSSKPDFSDASFEVTAAIESLSTDHDKRDVDLRGPDYLDAYKFPKLNFVSVSISKVSGNTYKLKGDLTLHGVTKPVELELVVNGTITHPTSKKTIVGIQVSGTIKRSDFGIAPGAPVMFISDQVKIKANGEFVKN